MADNRLMIGRITFPPNMDIQLRMALEDMVARTDDALNYLFKSKIEAITSDYTATDIDYTILGDATAGSITVTLPKASTVRGKAITIKKIDVSVNTVTIDGHSTETIDGATTQTLSTQYEFYRIQSDGSSWHIIS